MRRFGTAGIVLRPDVRDCYSRSINFSGTKVAVSSCTIDGEISSSCGSVIHPQCGSFCLTI
jgi:hypothetical protein